jgi:hypothetical protein
MPNITVAGVRALATKANGEMRSTGTALKDYKMATGALPLPVNEVSQPVEGHRIAIGGVDQSTKEVAIYYRGPSFVPDGLFEKVYDGPGPTDPFRRTDLGPYGYGAGPIQGTSAAFVPSSWGPDMESQAEQLEFLFLEEYWGDVDSFMADPEYMSLTYSPTNGLVSPGDLCRPVGRSKEYGKLNIP